MEIKKNEALGRPVLTKKVDMSVFVRTLVYEVRTATRSVAGVTARSVARAGADASASVGAGAEAAAATGDGAPCRADAGVGAGAGVVIFAELTPTKFSFDIIPYRKI